MSNLEFIKYIANLVVQQPSDFFNSVSIAQACVETGYGASDLYRGFNNAFGYKAKEGEWSGKVAGDYKSDEEINGVVVKDVPSDFRAYDSVKESVADHAYMMTSRGDAYKEIYADSINAKTPQEQAHALTNKYAGDSQYGNKLVKVIEQYNLTKYDKKESVPVAKLTLEQAFAKLGLTFKKQLLPLTKTYGRVNRKEGTVIHQTYDTRAGHNAQWMADYQKSMSSASNKEEKSWNYQVDDKEVIMSFEHDVATWQSSDGKGPGNMAHISIEACINSDGNYAKSIDNLAKTMAVIAYIEDFNIEKNTGRHYDFDRDKKWCPAQIMNGQGGYTYAKVKQIAQAHLDTLNGAVATPVDVHNPQGLQETKPLNYTAPRLPFEQLKVGDKVTLLDDKNANGDYIWLWYNPTNNTLLKSKKQAELAGTTDTIKEVKRIDKIQHSQYAYLLANTNSWILEEYLEEPRRSWEVVEVEDEDKVEDGKEVEPLKDGQFWWNDVLYQIYEVK